MFEDRTMLDPAGQPAPGSAERIVEQREPRLDDRRAARAIRALDLDRHREGDRTLVEHEGAQVDAPQACSADPPWACGRGAWQSGVPVGGVHAGMA